MQRYNEIQSDYIDLYRTYFEDACLFDFYSLEDGVHDHVHANRGAWLNEARTALVEENRLSALADKRATLHAAQIALVNEVAAAAAATSAPEGWVAEKTAAILALMEEWEATWK